MNTTETLLSRKSIRSYTGEKITEDELKAVLKAGYAAPVGMARYDLLQFTVIENAEIINEIDSAAAGFMEKMTGKSGMHPLYGAPTLILISSVVENPAQGNVAYSNAAIVAHNMILQATDLGLGVCHIWGAINALTQTPDLLAKLNLPEGQVPCCAVAIGKTNEKYEIREVADDRIKTVIIK